MIFGEEGYSYTIKRGKHLQIFTQFHRSKLLLFDMYFTEYHVCLAVFDIVKAVISSRIQMPCMVFVPSPSSSS